jgi:hypothetical protein
MLATYEQPPLSLLVTFNNWLGSENTMQTKESRVTAPENWRTLLPLAGGSLHMTTLPQQPCQSLHLMLTTKGLPVPPGALLPPLGSFLIAKITALS